MRAVLLVTLAAGALACASQPESGPNVPPVFLGNPVLDARNALASGDSSYLGIIDSALTLPGMDFDVAELVANESVRAFSQKSIGGSASKWADQRDSLTVYAAAYNRLVFEARSER